jgi:arylsulfatase A-like enzyme/Flp pilus assembly protein TadD
VKRSHLAIVAVAVAVIAAAVLWFVRRSATSIVADGPVIIFSIDTLRADRLPAYGYTGTRTPNIDRVVADGVLFENAYSHSPQTLPAHTSMLSGRLPFEHGVRDNIGFSVKPGERFIQHALKERGYVTGGFVSAYVLRSQTGFNQGFDTYDEELPPASPDKPLGQVQRPGDETVAAAARWIDRQTSDRFMAFVHIYEPHKPYTPPARFTAADRYDGEVEHADEIVGRFIDHLKAKQLYDRATIVLLSDHGEGLGDHGEDEHGIFLYRETIRVPLVIKLPGARGAGRRVAAPVQHIDIPPTILDLTGAAAGGGSRGRSLRPLLDGSGPLAKTTIYSESLSPRYHFGWSELYALSDDRYRLIRAPRDELYDIQQDPKELKSIAGERAQARTAMRAALDAIIANASVDAPSAVSAEDRQKLAALGYVGTQSGTSLTLPGDQLPDPKDKVGVLQKYKRATDLAGERKYTEAIAAYRALLRDDPDMTDAWLLLAEVAGRSGQIADSVAAYKEVVKRKPNDPSGLTGAAGGLLRMGRLDEARAHAELATGVAPATAHDLVARIAILQKDLEAARRHARLAQQADPTLPLPAFIEGLINYQRGEYAAAAPHFLEASRALATRTVQLADVNYYLGDSLARLERYAEAEQAFAAELRIFPTHVRAHAGLAMVYRATGRNAEAERVIGDLMRNSPTPEAYNVAAQLWTMFGEPARAAAIRARMPGRR